LASGDGVREVLTNWIGQALAPIGELPEGTDPAAWVADHFAAWWRTRAEEPLGDAERATAAVREGLERRGGWESFGEALEDLTHLGDALQELRTTLGLTEETDKRGL
jgi:hypothetical protein